MIHLILGPMFSGKTSQLILKMSKDMYNTSNIILIKYKKDIRYQGIASHQGFTYNGNIVESGDSLMQLTLDTTPDVIGIDEGQFFSDISIFCRFMLSRGTKKIYVSALDGSYEQKMFQCITELIPICDTITKLSACCRVCGSEHALFTKRRTNSNQLIVIGGSETYEPRCRDCLKIAQDCL